MGKIGELLVRGPNVMKSYHGLPEESAKTLRGGWLHTGDMARQDADSYLYLVERKKDLILRGGFNIDPREVEEVVIQHPGVLEVAVIGVPDAVFGEAVAAVVVLKGGQSLTEEELLSFCQARLAKNKSPRYVHFVSELPKNALGKMLRKELRTRFSRDPPTITRMLSTNRFVRFYSKLIVRFCFLFEDGKTRGHCPKRVFHPAIAKRNYATALSWGAKAWPLAS